MWIKHIPPEEAETRLRAVYDRLSGPDGQIDNILRAHSLRPHSLEGHMALYKATLHHHGNNLPKALLEAIGVYVSLLNGCDYCVNHHFAGLRRLLDDDAEADRQLTALKAERPDAAFGARGAAALDYAGKLTRDPAGMTRSDADRLRAAGFGDGEILEINQVAAYFAYANRTVLGLGVTPEGETLGYSPNNSDNENDWSHG